MSFNILNFLTLKPICFVFFVIIFIWYFNCCRWKALDFATLKRSSVSFFSIEKHETAMSKWARAKTRVAKVRYLIAGFFHTNECVDSLKVS